MKSKYTDAITTPIHLQGGTRRRIFRLIGLNRTIKSGIYATVEYGKEDWFHCAFDVNFISIERQYALFDMFKNISENLWAGRNHTVAIVADNYKPDGRPVKPIIVELFLDNI